MVGNLSWIHLPRKRRLFYAKHKSPGSQCYQWRIPSDFLAPLGIPVSPPLNRQSRESLPLHGFWSSWCSDENKGIEVQFPDSKRKAWCHVIMQAEKKDATESGRKKLWQQVVSIFGLTSTLSVSHVNLYIFIDVSLTGHAVVQMMVSVLTWSL